jgi:hypothetical protein
MPSPKLNIDLDAVEQYATLGLSRRVIASLLGFEETRIRRRGEVSAAYELGRAKRMVAVAKAQWQLLAAGNATMAIWLGKNELGQSDHPLHQGKPEPEVDASMG